MGEAERQIIDGLTEIVTATENARSDSGIERHVRDFHKRVATLVDVT